MQQHTGHSAGLLKDKMSLSQSVSNSLALLKVLLYSVSGKVSVSSQARGRQFGRWENSDPFSSV